MVLDTAEPLPFDTRTALDQYVRNGGGLAITGAASTAYPEWPEYNIMLGVTGFEGRDSKWGPLWFYENEKLVSRDVPGPAGWAAPQPSPFQVKLRAPGHAAMQGLPRVWTQLGDVQWGLLRGPGKRMTVLATAFCLETRRDEIVLATIAYGKGRVFHSLLGRTPEGRESTPFTFTFLRGVEWAATGKVGAGRVPPFPTEELRLLSR